MASYQFHVHWQKTEVVANVCSQWLMYMFVALAVYTEPPGYTKPPTDGAVVVGGAVELPAPVALGATVVPDEPPPDEPPIWRNATIKATMTPPTTVTTSAPRALLTEAY